MPVAGLLCLFPQVTSAMALVLGIAIALTIGNPYIDKTRKLTQKLLTFSVIGLGAGMDLTVVARVGLQGIGYTVIGIAFAMTVGHFLGRRLKVSGDTGLLVSVGTAICGGSAIAAVAPAIRAKSEEVSAALATVFCLNATALIIFPWIGHALDLSQTQFGLWSALAIHDTSSVVGATLQYGAEALQVGTTIKLARALWIIPLVWGISYMRQRREAARAVAAGAERPKAKRPWFILGFVIMAALVTFVPALQVPGALVATAAKRGLVVTLFLIGSNLTQQTLKSVGFRPMLQGVLLWFGVASATLGAILAGWIH